MSETTDNKLQAATETADIMPCFGNVSGFELAQRAGKLLSQSTLVPTEYQDNLPNCVIALNMASRMNADPLMVMQNLYVVHGRPGWSSQFLISTFNTSGKFSALRYEWVGEEGKDSWGCRAWAIEKATGEKLTGSTITIELAKKEGWYQKKGSKWQTMPQQMLMYRAAAWFIRAYAPELAMGMHTTDEIYDTIEIGPNEYSVMAEVEANANKETIDIDMEIPEEPKEAEKEPEAKEEAPKAGSKSKQATMGGPGF